jgi:tryptophan-rich sensory protein
MSYVALLVFLALVALAAVTGSEYMPGPWYETLIKPAWTPPNWLFPIAWTFLYIMIAVAGWRVWRAQGMGPALIVWGIGLALNALWSYLMFGLHRIDLALIDVIGMLLSILAFIWIAWPVDRTAALLFVPYLVWVSYAAALNAAIMLMN